nr:hypothetical protein [Sphingomonas azotifigens]
MTNYLIDLDHAVIVNVEATTAIPQAEGPAQRRMIERTHAWFGLSPKRLAAETPDTAMQGSWFGWWRNAASNRPQRVNRSLLGASRRSTSLMD